MSPIIIIVAFVSILFAVATYSIAKQQGAKPLGWAVGAFLAWPILALVFAMRFQKKPMLAWTIAADLMLVACIIYMWGGLQAASLERRSADNLKELGQAMIQYVNAHDGLAPTRIDDLRPYLARNAPDSDLPAALVSPYHSVPNVMGYRVVIPSHTMTASSDKRVRLNDIPADSRVIEDVFAPPDVRIGVYADGTVRSY